MDLKEKPYKFVVRLPLHLRGRIGEAARYYRRSMNSEIVARLEQSFSDLPSDGSTAQLEPDMHQQLESLFGNSALSPAEEKILRAFRRLSEEKKNSVLELIN